MTITTDQRPKVFPVLACQICGTKVENPKQNLYVPMVSRDPINGAGEKDVWFTRCLACNANTVRAWSYLEAHPRVRKALGSSSYAAIAVENTLAVFDLLAIDRATVETYFATDLDMMNTINALSTPGASLRWAAALVPFRHPNADLTPGWSFGGRWTHVGPKQRGAIATAIGGLLRQRTDHKRWRLPPFGPSGCLLCGVPSLAELTSSKESAWFGPHKAQPGVLGGKRTPEPVEGFLCSTCHEAYEQVGAMGPSAMEKSLMAHLGLNKQPVLDDEALEDVDIFAWVALPAGSPPNQGAWDHLGDLDAIKKKLENVPGVVVEFKSTRRNRAR